jgi:hypothetical protein
MEYSKGEKPMKIVKIIGLSLILNFVLNSSYAMFTQGDEDDSPSHAIPKASSPDSTIKKRKFDALNNSEESARNKKPTMQDSSTLDTQLSTLKEDLENAWLEANSTKIRQALETFNNLSYPEEAWENFAASHLIYRWASQPSWKETVGGDLFFPWQILDWEVEPAYQYLLRRRDTIWSCAIGAKFKHPISKLFLGKMLDQIRSAHSEEDTRPEIIDSLFKQSLLDLKENLNGSPSSPLSNYLLAYNVWHYPYLVPSYLDEREIDDEYALAQKGGDIRNSFQALKTRQRNKRDFGDRQPTIEEYLQLAKQGYGRAYIEASFLAETREEKKSILNQAINAGYFPAWIHLGYLFNEERNREEERSCYLKAGVYEWTRKHFDDISKEDFNKAVHYFRLAGESKNQQGWENLVRLYADAQIYEKAHNIKNNYETDYDREIFLALQEGIKLGSDRCYHWAYCWYDKSVFQTLIDVYGYPPQTKRFLQELQSFLYEDR